MYKFSDLKFGPRITGLPGIQAHLTFPNSYQASVIQGYGTYGNEEGLYELAVMHNGNIKYDTPITDDVVGNLSEDEVVDYLNRIAELPTRESSEIPS